MQIEQITLINWQSYRGEDNIFDFSGPESTNNSAILIARNAQGKSAFFDAVRFLLYGRDVVVDRDSTQKPKRKKPLVDENKGMKPLMCWEAWNEGETVFGVKARITIGQDPYDIERTYRSTSNHPAESDLSSTFTIYDAERNLVPQPENFINSLCPENITKFFTIDGELLIEYRQMFSTDRAGLADDIEQILRMNLLNEAIHHLGAVQRNQHNVLRRQRSALNKDNAHSKEMKDLEEEIEDITSKMEKNTQDLENANAQYNEVFEWLQTKGNTQATLAKIEEIKIKQVELDEEITQLEKTRSIQMTSAWKQVLNKQFEVAIRGQEEILERQRVNTAEIHKIESEILSRKERLAGRECPACNRTHEASPEERAQLSHDIVMLEARQVELTTLSGTPDPYPIMEKINKYKSATTDTKYSSVDEASKKIARLQVKSLSLAADLEETILGLGDDVLDGVREAQKNLKILSAKIKALKELDILHIRNLENLQNKYDILEGKSPTKGDKSALNDAENSLKLIDALGKVCRLAKTPFRDETRQILSQVAEESYKTMIDDDHEKLEVDSAFRLKVYDSRNVEAILSPGQMGLATYCILDALSIVSNVKFPLIVDSPGQGIDMTYMSKIFTYILSGADRQIIVLPTTAEMNVDTIAVDYGGHVASIYELVRPAGEKSTAIGALHRRTP